MGWVHRDGRARSFDVARAIYTRAEEWTVREPIKRIWPSIATFRLVDIMLRITVESLDYPNNVITVTHYVYLA